MKKNYFLFFLILFSVTSFAQDNCATAVPITNAGTYTVGTINGTELPAISCNLTNTSASAAEWYAYTPSQNYTVTVTSDLNENICLDTRLRIYSGTCASLTCIGGDDDSGNVTCSSGSSYLSRLTFNAIAGTTYYIVWDNRWSTAGFNFQISEIPAGYNPCAAATPITAGTTVVNVIDQTNITTACSSSSLSKWYSYTPTINANVTVSSDLMVNICKDTNFSVYSGNCPTGLTCIASDDNSGVIACNSGNTNSNLSVKTFEVTAGVTYYIVWDNKWSTDGFSFILTESPIIVPVSYNNQTIGTINSSYNICVVDMNGDFKDDIVGISANNLRIHFQGATAGTFTVTDFPISGTSDMPSWSMAAGDYNRDGYNDLVLGSGSGLTFWKSNSNGTAYTNVNPSEYIFCQRTNFVDINNDGHLDAFSCHDVAPNVYYMNDGNGNMGYYQSGTSGAYSLGITPSGGNYASLWTDFDNDGDLDMFISKCSGPPCELHRNDGNGVFTDISAIAGINVTPIQTWSSAVADFDNDDDMDVIITASAGTHKFFRNNLDTSTAAFTNITAGSGWDTNTSTNIDNVAYDFDNDGKVDVLGGGNKIMFNKGNNVFEATNYTAISVGAIGDLNNDGFLDILNGTTVRYAIPNGNNWVKVTLQGIQSNRNGIGARVEIYGPFGKQIRDIRSGEGFKYMSSLNAHFGIGTHTTISQIVINWPSGVVDVINNPNINETLSVIEGSSPLSLVNNEDKKIMLYPNPSSDNITLTNIENLEIKNVSIISTLGKVVKNVTLNESRFSITDLAEGFYILLIETTDGNKYSENFIKK
ncbi:MAG: T9SS type A sorting domain-containing protein [Flavobacteriaceae bacterium]|nr:MAG: T9SS type A sorting domain-containing protein [Flavobacteriaceae bacterium]